MAIVDKHTGHPAKGVLVTALHFQVVYLPVPIPSWEGRHYAHTTLKDWIFLVECVWILCLADSLHLH